jgi:hypothetical protein
MGRSAFKSGQVAMAPFDPELKLPILQKKSRATKARLVNAPPPLQLHTGHGGKVTANARTLTC